MNAGRNEYNYQVRDLAFAVAHHLPGTAVSINTSAQPDNRSYKVDFSLFEQLAPDFMPRVSLDESISRLTDGLRRMEFSDVNFRDSPFMRLRTLQNHISSNSLGSDLRWLGKAVA
ncbi:hypothetical protein [Hoeflea sp.]|uniref:hypothetical protein n=1 Tax=Hoeflea sp. TaxID=1940281 RepID=UPI003B01C702